jgi:hypothetical protein
LGTAKEQGKEKFRPNAIWLFDRWYTLICYKVEFDIDGRNIANGEPASE